MRGYIQSSSRFAICITLIYVVYSIYMFMYSQQQQQQQQRARSDNTSTVSTKDNIVNSQGFLIWFSP